jgi:cytochrome c peroxidase
MFKGWIWFIGFYLVSSLFLAIAAKPITPLPTKIEYDRRKAQLGKKLFLDTNLSKDGTIACATCHNFKNGADFRAKSPGVFNSPGRINAPTVFNSVFNFRQMWNGRVKNLKEQVLLPFRSPKEMAMSNRDILNYLKSNKEYRKAFISIYNKEPNIENFTDAIAEFEKALITPNSPFDRYLRREHNLTPEELEGYMLFKRIGCITCHNGVNIGGNSYQKFGLIKEYKKMENTHDLYSITSDPQDRYVFKVPSLRNIILTAPYLHTGEAETLKDAIKIMSEYNLGFRLEDDEVKKIETFLKTLTGEAPVILKENYETDH